MLKSITQFLLLVIPFFSYAQSIDTIEPKSKIDYWLKNHIRATASAKVELAQKVFDRLLKVADKPIGVLPRLHIFSDLKFGQVYALPDGNIIMPSSVIDFCLENRKHAEARLAFILGHELKHILRGDYVIEEILRFDQTIDDVELNDLIQRFWGSLEAQRSRNRGR